ncbi:MAG: tRNA pseudouridine synthase A [Phycisphaerales bacterium]|jgi:tRNA pseudouridine38-40 synthase|nr:tRNA pseudouridine synthase A [Phycisphaerales bacterium]
MPRYALTIAYDGTDFCGWQKQEPPIGPATAGMRAGMVLGEKDARRQDAEPAGAEGTGGERRLILRTVQEVVERAVREVVREPVILVGVSRTDAGVHAVGQVGAFTCGDGAGGLGWPIERGLDRLVMAINSRLPGDVAVTAARVVEGAFDPIADAVRKRYTYTFVSPRVGAGSMVDRTAASREATDAESAAHAIARGWVSPRMVREVFERNYVHETWHALDAERMNDAARHLVGTHDFASFAALGHGRESAVRTVFRCEVREESRRSAGDEPGARDAWAGMSRIVMTIEGGGFLYNMVRIIAGTLEEVGRGKIEPDAAKEILAARDRTRAGPTAPAKGLRLERVWYADEAE